jgi:hypothetical protein
VVKTAVRFTGDGWATTCELKPRIGRIPRRPTARIFAKRKDLVGGRKLVGRGGLFRRLKFGVAVCASSSLLDLLDGNRPSSKKTEHKADTARNGTFSRSPAPYVSHTDIEEPGEVPLQEAERNEEFGHGCFRGKGHSCGFYTTRGAVC